MATTKPSQISLKVSKKELEEGKVQLTVTIPASATNDLYRGAMYVLAMQNQFDMLNTKLEDIEAEIIKSAGEAQFNAFTNHYAMSLMAPIAVSKEKIEPIMEPSFSSAVQLAPNKAFTFVAVVTKKPHFELSSYDPVMVKIPKVTITEEEIDEQILYMAQRASTTVPDLEGKVGASSETVIGMSSTLKDTGEEIEHLTAEKREYEVGSGFLPTAFDKQLIGMKIGESKTFDYDLPGMPGGRGDLGKPCTVTTTVTISEINKRVTPAITDAWVKENRPEAKNVDGVREMLRQQGIDYKTQERENMKLFLSASALAERFEGTIADELYEHKRNEMLASLNEQLMQSGTTLQQYVQSMGMEQQQFNMNFMVQVQETLRQSFALDALARHLKLTASEEDIKETLSRMAPGNEERARIEIEGSGKTYIITEAALRAKANQWLVKTATFEEIEE